MKTEKQPKVNKSNKTKIKTIKLQRKGEDSAVEIDCAMLRNFKFRFILRVVSVSLLLTDFWKNL
jgi:hypothetical protein